MTPLDISNHYTGGMVGVVPSFGTSSFTTTGLTKVIPHSYINLTSAMITPKTATNSQEAFTVALSSGSVTVTRDVQTKTAGLALDEPPSGTNYAELPIMIAQDDMIITSVEWFQEVAFGSGTPLLNVGTTTDNDSIVDAGSITDTASTTTTFAVSNVAVSDGEVITLNTTGGLTTVATGCSVTIYYTTPTSGLEFSYQIWGI